MSYGLVSKLPKDRFRQGEIVLLTDENQEVILRARARGEADNANAARHDNIVEDPTRVGGDHPYGDYALTEIIPISPLDAPSYARYGPYFFRLDPVGGEALIAEQNGRGGFGIHGGRLHKDGRLRETFGCLRVTDEFAIELASVLFNLELPIPYVCRPL